MEILVQPLGMAGIIPNDLHKSSLYGIPCTSGTEIYGWRSYLPVPTNVFTLPYDFLRTLPRSVWMVTIKTDICCTRQGALQS
jgi:hypothetical protein